MERAWTFLFREETIWCVVRWLSTLGVPQCDLPDVTQSVVLEVIKGFPTYDPERACPQRWLYGIVLHVASHYFSKPYHRHEVLVEPTRLDVGDDDGSSVLDRILSEESRMFLFEVSSHLREDQAQILIGYHLLECPMLELAATRGTPVSTAYKDRARAFAAARSIARELLDDERLDVESLHVDGARR